MRAGGRGARARRAVAGVLGTLLVAALALGAGPGRAAELRRVEAVGVVPVGAAGSPGVPREAAVRAAVQSALLRVARSLLPEDFVPPPPRGEPDRPLPEPDVWIEEQLGDDPFAYAVRFSILEDRGSRPAVFASDPDVDEEYVVVAEVQIDVAAVRERLAQVGALVAPHTGTGRELRIVVQGLRIYPPLDALRETLLESPGVRAVLPVEFTRRHVLLRVDADRPADALVEELRRRAPAGLQIVPVETGPDAATVLVDWTPPGAAPAGSRARGAGD